jgi:hypothetical protein
MSSHDSFVSSGSSPNSTLCRDCWLTLDGVVLIERGKQHRHYFVPEGEPSKQFGLDLGHVRASTLGTNGSTLHFEFKQLSSQASRLIVDAIGQSHAELINLEFHLPQYGLRSNSNPLEAISFLKQITAKTAHLGLVSGLDSVRQHIREQFEQARRVHERPRIPPTDVKPEVSLTDRAAPIFRRIITTPAEHRRRDCVSYEIVEPNVHDLNALFDEALVSLGFNKRQS